MKEKQQIFRSASLNDLQAEKNAKRSFPDFRDDMKTANLIDHKNPQERRKNKRDF